MKIRNKFLTLALTASLVGGFEGYRNYAYFDPVNIPTACFGATKNPDNTPIKIGQAFSYEQCEELLYNDLFKHRNIVLGNVDVSLTEPQKVALTSFVYNVGEGNFKSSTFLRKINNGYDVGKACKEELPRWVYAKGIKLNGLIKRRQKEAEICNMERLNIEEMLNAK